MRVEGNRVPDFFVGEDGSLRTVHRKPRPEVDSNGNLRAHARAKVDVITRPAVVDGNLSSDLGLVGGAQSVIVGRSDSIYGIF